MQADSDKTRRMAKMAFRETADWSVWCEVVAELLFASDNLWVSGFSTRMIKILEDVS